MKIRTKKKGDEDDDDEDGTMTYQFLTKKTVCSTVCRHQCKTYHQSCGVISTIVHHNNRCPQH
eukprot:5013709-Prorocentrum_lima.AAC.1